MNNFSFTRFKNVARWDLAINRPFYIKAALLIFIVMALPLLWSMFTNICALIVTGGLAERPTYVPCLNMFNFFLGLMPFVCGYVFHNLLTRQGRIAELTLPATNCEKFLWHILSVVAGSLLVAFLSMVILDFVQMFYVGILSGFSHVESGLLRLFHDASHTPRVIDHFVWGRHLVVWSLLFFIASCSFFVLGNAVKYKHNIILTLLVGGAASFFLVICFATLIANYGQPMTTIPEGVFIGFFYAFLLILIVAQWCAAYLLYTRAQITSKRNK